MREAIGGSFLFQIVILFLLIFSGYLCLAVNYTSSHKVKNDIIEIVERHDSIEEAQSEIEEYLQTVGYRNRGTCTDGYEGLPSGQSNYLYCYKKIKTNNVYDAHYYKIKVFFSVDLPVLNNVFKFTLTGDTKELMD